MISGPTGRGRYSLLNGYLALVLLLWQGNAPVDVSQVTTALRENRFSTALQLTKGLLVRGAQDPQIWTLQGLAHEGLKEPAEALHDFKQALSIAPDYMPALKAEAQAEYAIHDRQCVQTLNRIAELEPGDPVSHAMLAALAYQRQDCRAVVMNYSVSETLISSQATALSEYGQCLFERGLFERGQKDKAVEVFAKAVELGPTSWQARYNLAVANLLLDRAPDSLAAVQPIFSPTSRKSRNCSMWRRAPTSGWETLRARSKLCGRRL